MNMLKKTNVLFYNLYSTKVKQRLFYKVLLYLTFKDNFSRQIELFRVLKDKKRWNEGPSNGNPLSWFGVMVTDQYHR